MIPANRDRALGNLYSKVCASVVIACRNTLRTGKHRSMAVQRSQNLKNLPTGKQRLCAVCLPSDLAGFCLPSDIAMTIELHIIL